MGNIKPRVIPYGRESVRIGTVRHFAGNVPGLGSVMSTESDQSSGNRQHGSSSEEERQRTGLFRWDDPENLVPPWSVPPGLMIPGPRQPKVGDSPEPAPPSQVPEPAADGQTAGGSAADDNSWPGVAPPAGWFLRAPQPSAASPENASPENASPENASPENASPENASPENASPENASPENASPENASPENASPENASPETVGPDIIRAQDAGDEALPGPEPRDPAPTGPASPRPHASPWLTASAVPSPRREPDGSWSSPLTPKPPPRALGATQALHGQAGSPGFQPSRSARPATPAAATPAAANPAAANPARHPEHGGTFPVATVPPDLERGRHSVGAPGSAATAIPAPGPAAIAAPAPGTPVPPAVPAAAGRRPAHQARASRAARRRLARPGSGLARPGSRLA